MKKFLLLFGKDLHTKLKIKSIETGISMNDLIIKAIEEFLK